jgi:hypothetical protein
MKVCSCCKNELSAENFYKSSKNKDGLRGICKKCIKDQSAAYYSSNKEHYSEHRKEYYLNNKEEYRKRDKKWVSNNKGKVTAKVRQRELNKSKRTPFWADSQKIQSYYSVCSFFNEVNGYTKYHVDHIIPLHGKNVSGLHVHTNLQIIPAKENLSKGNKHNG